MPLPRNALVACVLLVVLTAAGCLSPAAPLPGTGLPAGKVYDTSRGWSTPLSPALYDLLEPVKEFVASFDGTSLGLGLFFPAIEGCDWKAEALPAACKLPVVMDAGPYYSSAVDRDKFRPPLVEWLVPRGYVVVQMAVRGTAESAGCMEFMSLAEQQDVDHVVTWLATQAWSNGNVGMMGRSYDGTTPLFPAAMGNPHLKTIVPISGVTSVRDLMFKNGTSELRGPIMHSVVYWATYGVMEGGPMGHRADHWTEQACEQFLVGALDGPLATLTGDASGTYWTDRDWKQRIVENYKGSIWVVHGLEDWNVNPSLVVPWINELQDAGVPTRAWLGVWAHAYPDRVDEHRNVRWDWADQTVQWFDHWLKGQGPSPTLDVEVEDRLFVWRHEASYPPRDATLRTLELSGDGSLAEPGAAVDGEHVLVGGTASAAADPLGDLGPAGDTVAFTSERFEEDQRIAGLPQLHLTITPSTSLGGAVFAELYDVFPDGRTWRIGWGAIDLRFHDGGNEGGHVLTPGQAVVAQMEFEPTDTLLARGHALRLVVHRNGVEDILPTLSPEPVSMALGSGASVLHLPLVDRPTALAPYAPPGLGP